MNEKNVKDLKKTIEIAYKEYKKFVWFLSLGIMETESSHKTLIIYIKTPIKKIPLKEFIKLKKKFKPFNIKIKEELVENTI